MFGGLKVPTTVYEVPATDNQDQGVYMPRPQRPLDPQDGPVRAFAAELRKLHETAGSPTFLKMARKTGKSRTALSEAAGGDHLPSWETVAAFVTACGANPNDWRVRWEQTRDEARAAGAQDPTPNTSSLEPASSDIQSNSRYRMPPWRQAIPYVLVALISSAITGAVTLTLARSRPAAVSQAIITVQNKVAIGAKDLREDDTPSYLSSVPQRKCALNGCKVGGSELASGARLIAICYVRGPELVNYNLDSSEVKTNPNRVRSTLWYKAILPDGRSGYISEIYVTAANRGGMGLPTC